MEKIRLILAPRVRRKVYWETLVKVLQEIAGQPKNKVHVIEEEPCVVCGVRTSRIVIKDVGLGWSFGLYAVDDQEIYSPPQKGHYLQRITVHSQDIGKKRQLAESNLMSLLGALTTHFVPASQRLSKTQ